MNRLKKAPHFFVGLTLICYSMVFKRLLLGEHLTSSQISNGNYFKYVLKIIFIYNGLFLIVLYVCIIIF